MAVVGCLGRRVRTRANLSPCLCRAEAPPAAAEAPGAELAATEAEAAAGLAALRAASQRDQAALLAAAEFSLSNQHAAGIQHAWTTKVGAPALAACARGGPHPHLPGPAGRLQGACAPVAADSVTWQAMPNLLAEEAADWDDDLKSLVHALHECEQPIEAGLPPAKQRPEAAVMRMVLPQPPGAPLWGPPLGCSAQSCCCTAWAPMTGQRG